MGKTSKPLRIVAYPPVSEWLELAALEAQGHEVYRLETEADLVLGPQAWHFTEAHRKYLSDAIAAARAKRYPKEPTDAV